MARGNDITQKNFSSRSPRGTISSLHFFFLSIFHFFFSTFRVAAHPLTSEPESKHMYISCQTTYLSVEKEGKVEGKKIKTPA